MNTRAVTRLLECGGADAAQVLERAAPAVTGAADAAAGLRRVSPLAERLRTTPTRSITTEHLSLLRHSHELQTRMRAIAAQERQLPGGASERQLRRLAAPALEFAKHMSALAMALEVSVRESLADGLMLVPSRADGRNRSDLMWVTSTMGPRRDGPPTVQQLASQLARAAEQVGPGVCAAREDLARHSAAAASTTSQAAAAARSHVGAARGQLRAVLTHRLSEQPVPPSAQLPSHPRLAPGPSIAGPRR